VNVPEQLQTSPAMQFILTRGWNWRQGTAPNIELETCPYCEKTGYGHFYIEVHGLDDPQKNRDGLHTCQRCGKGGTLYALKSHLGAVTAGVESRRDWSGAEKKVETLPDIDACHQALLEDADAMDYLVNGRGFSRDIIARQQLGLVPKRYFRETGEVRSLVYPYLVNGNCIYVHFRTLPTMPLSENKVVKAFSSPTGWEAPLYNGEILRDGLTEVFFVEGEANCIAAMDHGVESICGVPGANFKKAEWIDTLDALSTLERIYICYDKDKVGQKAAQALATRIGIERCWKINLPDFTVTTDEGLVRPGKDLNEYFAVGGGTSETFEKLKQDAKLFDVDGVSSSNDATQEFLDELNGKLGLEPKYKTQWDALNKLVGFDEGDVIDILAPEKIGKTTFAMNLIEHMVDTYGEDGIIICLEMTRARLARKWVAYKAQIEDNIPKSIEQSQALAEAFKKAIPEVQQRTANREGELFFCYPKYKTVDDIYNLIRDCIRRYGVKWVVIDNIQRLADTTRGSSRHNERSRTEHLSEISKTTSQIAKDYNIQLVRILQPNRIGDGKMVTTDNVDGSSQIAKDCDCMITLHRNRIGTMTQDNFDSMGHVEQEVTFDDKMLTTVGLSRYSSGGYTTLMYDGARSTVNDFTIQQVARMQAQANKDVGYDAQRAAIGLPPAAAMGGGEITI
jgi:hypothetical protein